MAADGSITMPQVKSGGDTFAYTFRPAPTETSPARFVASRVAANPASADCASVLLPAPAAATIEAAGIARYAQTVSVTFQDDGAGAFRKVGASVKGGNLDGFVGELTPLSGATVTVANAAGAVVATGRTNEWGSMIVTIGELPDNFRVTATGGTMSGAPFTGSLKAEVRDYATIGYAPQVTVTPLTTLISAYQQRYPGLSLAETMNQVEAKLEIPVSFDSDAVGQDTGDYVDASVFYAQAGAAGGVDAFVLQVLAEWEEGTDHKFVPAVEVDRQKSTAAIKMLAPGAASTSAACAGPCPLRVGPLEVAGLAYTIYAGDKTAKWQADVVNRLAQIQAQINRLDSAVGVLTTKVDVGNYQKSKDVARPWINLVTNAFTALHWLATNPATDYMPPSLESCALATVPDNQKAACTRWTGWLKAVDERRAEIAVVTASDPTTIAARGKPMASFQEALSGDGIAGGMLRSHRAYVYGQVSDASKHLFFTPDHSNEIWNHYRYWTNLQALTYFFFADYYIGQGRNIELQSTGTGDSKVKGLTELHADAAAAALRAMPLRILPASTYIDVHNTTFHGTPAGGPLMWMPTKTICSFFGIPFDQANVTVQSSLTSYFNCLNATDAGHGLRDWRIPTELEFYAFTQTEGNPGRNVGAWMTERGMHVSIGNGLNGQTIYVAYTRDCVNTYYTHNQRPSRFPCSRFSYYFDYYEYSDENRYTFEWRPFMVFNSNQRLRSGTQGDVFPVRPVNANEYW